MQIGRSPLSLRPVERPNACGDCPPYRASQACAVNATSLAGRSRNVSTSFLRLLLRQSARVLMCRQFYRQVKRLLRRRHDDQGLRALHAGNALDETTEEGLEVARRPRADLEQRIPLPG